jgi:hypothetical protein
VRQHGGNLPPSEDDRQVPGLFGAHDTVQPVERVPEHFSIEEQQRAQGLVLRRGADAPATRQVLEEGTDLLRSQLVRMTPLIEENETPDPADVRSFRTGTVVARADGGTDAVE